MLRKILICCAALFVTGCYDPVQKEYDIRQAQHERALDQIMELYDTNCSPPLALAGTRDDSYCNGLRQAYWAILSDRNMQDLEPSAR